MRFGSAPLAKASLFIYLPSMLMSLGQGMIIPALPNIAQAFGVSEALAVQAITSQLVGRTAARLPSGALVDRLGTKPLMVGRRVARDRERARCGVRAVVHRHHRYAVLLGRGDEHVDVRT